MINFKTEEEKMFVGFYAKKIGDELSQSIIERLVVSSSNEADHLSSFFWDMVDAAIQDEKNGIDTPWDQGSEYLSEKVMYAISAYLEKSGYEKVWEEVSDSRN